MADSRLGWHGTSGQGSRRAEAEFEDILQSAASEVCTAVHPPSPVSLVLASSVWDVGPTPPERILWVGVGATELVVLSAERCSSEDA